MIDDELDLVVDDEPDLVDDVAEQPLSVIKLVGHHMGREVGVTKIS